MEGIKQQLNDGQVDRLEAAPRPGRSRRGLHRLLRGQQGPDALRPLPGARLAGRIRRRSRFKRAGCRWSKAGTGLGSRGRIKLTEKTIPATAAAVSGQQGPDRYTPVPASWKAPAQIVGSRFKRAGCRWSTKQEVANSAVSCPPAGRDCAIRTVRHFRHTFEAVESCPSFCEWFRTASEDWASDCVTWPNPRWTL